MTIPRPSFVPPTGPSPVRALPAAPAVIGRPRRAAARAPPRIGAGVVLRFSEGSGEAEPAAALGCSVVSVKSQTSRGLARLRELLDLPSTANTSEATR